MIYVVITFHVIVCLFLIAVVLLQSSKGSDVAAAFGGMGSQTTFGPRSAATLLSKATTIAAGIFMVTSLALAIMESRGGGSSSSVLDRTGTSTKAPEKKAPTTTAPAAPAPANPAAPAPTSNVPLTPVPSTPEPAKK